MKSTLKLLQTFGLLLFMFVFVFGLLRPDYASAARADHCATPAFNVFGRAGCDGYFTNNDSYDAGSDSVPGWDILIDATNNADGGALINVTTAGQFINTLKGYLNQAGSVGSLSYDYNAIGAAFIIDGMLGEDGGDLCPDTTGNPVTNPCTWQDGVTYAMNNEALWAITVRDYAGGFITGASVNWNATQTLAVGAIDSTHDCGVGNTQLINCGAAPDDKDLSFRRNTASVTVPMIVFHNPDGSTFRIRKDCGNVIGGNNGPLSPPPQPTCNVTFTPARPDPSTPIAITGTVDYRDNRATTLINDGVNMTISVINSGGTTVSSNNVAMTRTATVVTGNYTAPATGSAGAFTLKASIPQDGAIPPESCQTTVTIARMPYFSVDGGDVSAGESMGVGGTECATRQDGYGSITGWNEEAPTYAGSGTQYAAFAMDLLQDFATAQSTAASAPAGLSFSNTMGNSPGGAGDDTYGGLLGSEPCIPDYYSAHPSNPSHFGAHVYNGLQDSANPGTYKTIYIEGTGGPNGPNDASLTFSGVNALNIQDGAREIIYVDGNVYISKNILYSDNYTGGLVDLPSFTIIARGNIYIDNSVSELDGWYIAEPSSPTSTDGVIYTCASGLGSPAPLDRTLASNCNNQLKVYGSFVGRQIWLERTFSTLSSGNRAERFYFTPETWLANPLGDSSLGTTYDSVTTLPPSL